MTFWAITIRRKSGRPIRVHFNFTYPPSGNDLLIALALTEDRRKPDTIRDFMRELRYEIPADLEIKDGPTYHNEIVVVSTKGFIFSKEDTDTPLGVQSLPGSEQPTGKENVPTVFFNPRFLQSAVAQTGICLSQPSGTSDGSPQDNSVRNAVGPSDDIARWHGAIAP